MSTAKSFTVSILLFGVIGALMLNYASNPSPLVTALFAIGELGGTGAICSLIFRQPRRRPLSGPLATGMVAGFVISHLTSLALLQPVQIDSQGDSAAVRGTLVWMELTLRVGLFVVVVAAAAVLLKARARRPLVPRMRKVTATA